MTLVVNVNGVEYRAFNRTYAASSSGAILKLRGFRVAPQKARNGGYMRVGPGLLVHRIVATCWCDKPDETDEVHHVNGDKTDNRAENLVWVSGFDHRSSLHSHGGRYVRTEATRQKLREWQTGNRWSDERKQKLRDTLLRLGRKPPGRAMGSKMPPDFGLKQSEKHWANTLCEIDGVRYRSIAEAGKTLGIKPGTLRRRCHSKNFPRCLIVSG